MAIQIDRSNVAGYIPTTMVAGSFFYNEADNKLYVGESDGTPNLISTDVSVIEQRLAALEAQSSTTVSASAPASPTEGDLWYDTDDNILKIYVDGAWVVSTGSAEVGALGAYPVTLDEFFRHIRFTPDALEEVDGLQFIAAATNYAENYTKRLFYNRNFNQYFDEFPVHEKLYRRSRRLTTTPIRLFGSDVKSITSFQYYDQNGDLETLVESTDYRKINKNSVCYLHPSVSAEYWPTDAHDELHDIIEINYNAGPYPGEVPAAVKSAILLIAASLFENRENDIIGSGLTVNKPIIAAQDLLHPYKVR